MLFECVSLAFNMYYVLADTSLETSIPVQLDGEESVLDLIDVPYTGVSVSNIQMYSTRRSFSR